MVTLNAIGKFEARRIIDAVDSALIRDFGINMLDAQISRYEALQAYEQAHGCATTAARTCAISRGCIPYR